MSIRRRVAVNPGFNVREWRLAVLERGHPTYRNAVVMRGTVHFIRKVKRVQRLYTDHGNFWFKWFMDRIPPNVRSGDVITITGNLETMNAGTLILITDALLIPEGYKGLMQDLTKAITNHILDPKTYIDRGEISDVEDQKGLPVSGSREL